MPIACNKQSGTQRQSDRIIHVTRNLGGRDGFRKHWEAWKGAFERDNTGWKMELIDLEAFCGLYTPPIPSEEE